jgi:sugar phosphate isomerase/epimerase
MRIGLCSISNTDASVRSVLSTAADAGYDGVEIWGDGHVGDGGEEAPERVADTAAEFGLEIPVYGSYLRAGTDAFEREVADELATAESLGASLIRVWPGTQEYQEHGAGHWDRVVADLLTLSRRGADLGIGVTVEKHEGTLTNRTAGARELLAAVDHENCGLNYQPLFFLPADELAAEARELAPYSNNVHLQAVGSRGANERTLLEDAYFDCEAVLEPFRDGSFSGYVEVEFVDPDRPYDTAVRRDLEYLRSISTDTSDR